MVALALLGCGGGGGDTAGSGARGELTGIVFDPDGKPVANARVYVDSGGHRETRTDSAGRYVLGDVADQDVTVRAELKPGAGLASFFGQNLGRSFGDSSTPNVNITLYDEADLVSLTGQVRNSAGNVLRGVRVSARSTDGKILSSASAFTDDNGIYTIARLAVRVEYQVVGSAVDIGDDSKRITIPASPNTSERTQDLVLGNFTLNAPDVPTGIDAVAYTTPGAATTRGAAVADAYEGLKRQLDPKRAARMAKRTTARSTALGRPISIDLFWNEYPIELAVRPAGFIVYRNEAPTLSNGYVLDDPLAVLFSDSDVALLPGSTYTYALKSVSVGYLKDSEVGRSALSTAVSVTPLGDLELNGTSGNTVLWKAVPGADTYTVYVYNRYPDVFAADALVATASPTGINPAGTSATIDDPDVVPGGTYYYVVVGSRSNGSALTFSNVAVLQP